jgi:hypothetical protein
VTQQDVDNWAMIADLFDVDTPEESKDPTEGKPAENETGTKPKDNGKDPTSDQTHPGETEADDGLGIIKNEQEANWQFVWSLFENTEAARSVPPETQPSSVQPSVQPAVQPSVQPSVQPEPVVKDASQDVKKEAVASVTP